MIKFSVGGWPPWMERPILWRVLWQPGPPGHEGKGRFFDRSLNVGRSLLCG